jgi:hypothetical protein
MKKLTVLAIFATLSAPSFATDAVITVSIPAAQVKHLPDQSLSTILDAVKNVALTVPSKENQDAYIALQKAAMDRVSHGGRE